MGGMYVLVCVSICDTVMDFVRFWQKFLPKNKKPQKGASKACLCRFTFLVQCLFGAFNTWKVNIIQR